MLFAKNYFIACGSERVKGKFQVRKPCLKLFGPTSEKRVYSKRKAFAPNSFLLELTSYRKWIGVQGSNQEITKVVSLI